MTTRMTLGMLSALATFLTLVILGALDDGGVSNLPRRGVSSTSASDVPPESSRFEEPPVAPSQLTSALVAPVQAGTGQGSDAEDGFVIAGVAVHGDARTPLSGKDLDVSIRSGSRSYRRPLRTDRAGRFRVRGLPPGNYRLTFAHPGFRRFVADISLRPGISMRDLDVVFLEGLDAWGRVYDLDANPVEGVVVEWNLSQRDLDSREVTTDSRGEYRIGGLRPGRYFVRVYPKRLRAAWTTALRQIVIRDGSHNRFDFTEDVGASLPVIVLDGMEKGVRGIRVRYRLRAPGRGIAGILPATDSGGATWLRGLPSTGTLLLAVADNGGRHARLELKLPAGGQEALLRLE